MPLRCMPPLRKLRRNSAGSTVPPRTFHSAECIAEIFIKLVTYRLYLDDPLRVSVANSDYLSILQGSVRCGGDVQGSVEVGQQQSLGLSVQAVEDISLLHPHK